MLKIFEKFIKKENEDEIDIYWASYSILGVVYSVSVCVLSFSDLVHPLRYAFFVLYPHSPSPTTTTNSILLSSLSLLSILESQNAESPIHEHLCFL